MQWIVFTGLLIVLTVAVARVFSSPGRRKRSGVATRSKPSAALEATAPVAPPTQRDPDASTTQSTRDEVPVLFTPDPEEPATVVTERFKTEALQDFLAGTEGASLPFGFILVAAVGRSDVGRRRRHNEDSYLVHSDEHVFVVADGMGGHAAGEVASSLAVATMLRAFDERRFDGEADLERPRRADELVRAIQMANRAIFAMAEANHEQKGMGTTVVAARFAPTRQRVFIAHVGDSRCYRLRSGQLVQMTRDHTMRAFGVGGREGEKLTRAVGIANEVEVDVTDDTPEAGDMYLICSDGVTKMLADDAIAALLQESTDPEFSVRRLVEAANERGGRDNITAIVMQVHAASSI